MQARRSASDARADVAFQNLSMTLCNSALRSRRSPTVQRRSLLRITAIATRLQGRLRAQLTHPSKMRLEQERVPKAGWPLVSELYHCSTTYESGSIPSSANVNPTRPPRQASAPIPQTWVSYPQPAQFAHKLRPALMSRRTNDWQ